MNQEIESVEAEDQIICVATLARQIWNQHFVAIIGQAQVDYMLDRFQSPVAIRAQMDTGCEYYLARCDEEPVGYIGLIPHQSGGKLMLSKLYVKSAERGAGVGSLLLEFTMQRARETGAIAVWLTVNRHNTASIEWYKRRGFAVTGELKKDIGCGFYMDDFVMERGLG